MKVNFVRLGASVIIMTNTVLMLSCNNDVFTKNETIMIAWIGFIIGLFLAALSFELKNE
jgi:hypothetical protein